MATKILVLGGNRFIGRTIVNVLTYYSYDVTILNRGSEPNLFEGVSQIIADRNDEEAMREALKDHAFDVVVDVSGKTKFQCENVIKSLELSDLKKYIYISSSAVYDYKACILPFKEDDPKGGNCWGQYGMDKLAAENYLIEQFENTPIECIILRFPYVYGPYNNLQRERLIFHHLVNDRPIYVPNDGNTKIQFYYVKDAANLVLTCISEPCANITIYNAGNQKFVTFNEWIAMCEDVVGKKGMVYHVNTDECKLDFFPFACQDIVLDVSSLQPFFHKEIDFRLGLEESFKWFKENEDLLLIDEQQLEAERELAKKFSR